MTWYKRPRWPVTILVFAGLASHFDYSDSAAAVDSSHLCCSEFARLYPQQHDLAGVGAGGKRLMTPS